jgi:hypothetical protein
VGADSTGVYRSLLQFNVLIPPNPISRSDKFDHPWSGAA